MQQRIDRPALACLLDEHLLSYLSDETYEMIWVDPFELITHNRLDIAIKILYLKMSATGDPGFARELYTSHIKAFSLGSFKEPGNEDKNSIQKYLDVFDSIFESIRDSGVDTTTSIVPRSINGSISNGSHRVASAFVAGQQVPTVVLPIPEDKYDASFFLERGMSRQQVETSVTRFIEYAENCHIALIWPSAEGGENEYLKFIPDIIYKSHISLNYSGAHNLITQIYYGEPWLGERDANFPGARNKLVECFKNMGPLRVVAFQAESLEKVQAIKDEIRQVFDIGKHSIHISDTKEEAIRVARILFNENSIHFLNHGKPNKFPTTISKINWFKECLNKNEIKHDSVVIDSSHILSLYGLRESKDIDYLALQDEVSFYDELIQDHSAELEFHQQPKVELVFNDRFYFCYEDLKFISFDQLYCMKKNRGETKDMNDLAMMSALLENNGLKYFLGLLRQNVFYFIARLKLQLIRVLRVTGLYNTARFVYRFFAKRRGN